MRSVVFTAKWYAPRPGTRRSFGALARVLIAAIPLLATAPPIEPALAQAADPAAAVPGFWDPRRRPERPDLSRVSIIRFLTEIDYPPFNYAGPGGNPAGFNVDLARTMCEELKVNCTVQMRRFDTLVDALAENRGDAVIASLAVTSEARRRIDFTDPYYRSPARFVARRDSTIEDVRPERLEGRKVAVVAQTAHEAYLKSFFTEVELRSYPNAEATREALRRGEVDLLFGDGIALAFWLNGSDSAGCCVLQGRPVHREPLLRRRGRHRGAPRQRDAAARPELGAVPAVGEGAVHRPVAALFSGEPVLGRSRGPWDI